jgi:hypothetical protein
MLFIFNSSITLTNQVENWMSKLQKKHKLKKYLIKKFLCKNITFKYIHKDL